MGAKAFPMLKPTQDLREVLEFEAQKAPAPVLPSKLETPDLLTLIKPPCAPSTAKAMVAHDKSKELVKAVRETAGTPLAPSALQPVSVLDAIRPLILGALDKARTSQDVAKRLKI